MTLFLSEEEFQRCSHDAFVVAQKADEFIRDLYNQLETVKAQSDAASITAEQTCSLLEQKYVSLSSEFSNLQSQYSQLNSTLEQRASELAQLEADKHQIHLQSIGKDGEIERLSLEASELHKSKRQLIELMEHKDSEINEKNASNKGYLDKIVNLTESAAMRESRISELEAELSRCRASCARLSQEKEIIERHNVWLNEELTAKVNSLMELRRVHSDLDADMSSKLEDLERKYDESSSSLKWKNDRIRELELNLTSLQEELCSSKDAAAATEERFSAELSTVNKLVELYKESSEEWSKKAGELEGVIRALETHASQLEKDYKEKLEKEISIRKEFEKEAANLKEKLEKCEAELESSRSADALTVFRLSSSNAKVWGEPVEADDMDEDNRLVVPSIPAGISGTALAASLLRDGWSLAKMYAKYQEAVDALRHEQLGRKQAQAILERVLYEIEEKAGVILDERAEHERMAEAYSAVDEKLQNSISEQAALDRIIQELKADIRKRERDYSVAQMEIVDLQKQVTVLLKECRDIQLRCGSADYHADERTKSPSIHLNANPDAENVIPEWLLTFKDINGLVEQNVQLRSLVRLLSKQIEDKEGELTEKFEKELQEHSNEAASKVDAVLARAEEQGRMIESLHTSVAMYKKLYEEEHKLHSAYPLPQETAPEGGRKEVMLLLESSHEAARKAKEQAYERVKCLEEEVTELRGEIISIRSQRDKLSLEANFAQEKLERFMKEFENQRKEINAVIGRNVEFSQIIVDYQRKLREGSESLHAAEELSRKLNMEVSVLKQEKEILSNAEKRACEEVRSLSERVYRLQATLDTIQSAEEVHEEARSAQRRKQEDYVNRIEREWTEARKELQEERDNVRRLALERDSTMKNATQQIEEKGKELANALRAVAEAEARAAIAESRYSELEKSKLSENKVPEKDGEFLHSPSSINEVSSQLRSAKEEIEKLRVEVQVNKDHMLQYKSIAQVNEAALKQMEVSYENFKLEADKVKKSLEDELSSLKEQVNDLQNECSLKTVEAASAAAGQEEALASSLSELASLREERSEKLSRIVVLESQMSAMKDDLEKEHQRWRTAQDHYERQVILQSETIQELTKTSQALASVQMEASELRGLVDSLKIENNELKEKWKTEKSVLEKSKNEAEKKYNEINEQNKILHSRLEAFHIKLAEKNRSAGGSSSGSSSQDLPDDAGLQNVVNYLRRSKEIAETEISLLKQEKLRLQSQLESALKAAETAQGSLRAERANSRSLLFTEEEFKALQLQVSEMNLLRESNIQLREENRHNFEECQKLRQSDQKARMDIENLESLLNKREAELEACRREIEMQMTDRKCLEKRVDELLERYKDIDPEDYDRMRNDVQQMQAKLSDKDASLEEIKKFVCEKQDAITQLEQEFARSKAELNEREVRITDVVQAQATLKSELERHKKFAWQFRKKSDNLSKEKDDLNRQIQTLSKELEDFRQGKKSGVAAVGDHALREIEEKDTRIQMLEKTLERLRDELRREKEENRTEKAKRQEAEKVIADSNTVNREKPKLAEDLEKLKQALKNLLNEVQKLKHVIQLEDTSVVQHLSGGPSDDVAVACLLAIDNFEHVAHRVFNEMGGPAPADTSSVEAISSLSSTVTEMVPAPAPSMLTPVVPAANTAEERGKMLALPRPNLETRKAGRRLVRPRIVKPEKPQVDVEMLEVEGANNGGKLLSSSSSNSESQANVILPSQQSVRKRPSVSSTLEEQEESLIPRESSSSDVAGPTLKKYRGSESPQDGAEEHLEVPESLPSIPEGSPENVGDESRSFKEEAVDAERDEAVEAGEEQTADDPKVSGNDQTVLQTNRGDIGEESLDLPSEAVVPADQPKVVEAEQDMMQQATAECGSDPEEGELVSDFNVDLDGGGAAGSNISSNIIVSNQETGEAQPVEPLVTSPSPGQVDEEVTTPGEMEISSPQVVLDDNDDEDDKSNEGDIAVEEIAHEGSSDRLNDEGNDDVGTTAAETANDQTRKSAGAVVVVPDASRTNSINAVEVGISKPEGSSLSSFTAPLTEVKQEDSVLGTTATTINLHERARQRSQLRLAGTQSSTPVARGRGRALRGRGGRGGRVGRGGQAPGQQGT